MDLIGKCNRSCTRKIAIGIEYEIQFAGRTRDRCVDADIVAGTQRQRGIHNTGFGNGTPHGNVVGRRQRDIRRIEQRRQLGGRDVAGNSAVIGTVVEIRGRGNIIAGGDVSGAGLFGETLEACTNLFCSHDSSQFP